MKQKIVSIVIPTYNSAKYLSAVFDAILAQNYPTALLDIIIVDDNSKDNTREIVESYAFKFKNLRFIVKNKKSRKGAAVSTNIGIKLAKGEIVCSIDSDAIISKEWLRSVVSQFRDPKVASVAGYISTANPKFLPARLMGAELEDRYRAIKKKEVGHVSTCNTAYRKAALKKVNYFDPEIYYGYDVEISYKLRNAGYKILLLKNIGCKHYWKESFKDYLRQQFNVAYGRLQLVSKYPEKKSGDTVSGLFMIAQVPLTLLFIVFLILQTLHSFFYFRYSYFAAIFCLFILFLIQLPQSCRLFILKKDVSMFLLPFFNLIRNFMWLSAFFVFYYKKVKFFKITK